MEVEKSMNLIPKLLENLDVSSSGGSQISTVIGLGIGIIVMSHANVTSQGR